MMKKVYTFNAKKYIARAENAGIDVDLGWAVANNNRRVNMNEELGYGVLDGRLICQEVCDKGEAIGNVLSIGFEPETELERVLDAVLKEEIEEHKDTVNNFNELLAVANRLQDGIDELTRIYSSLRRAFEEFHDDIPIGFSLHLHDDVFIPTERVFRSLEPCECTECECACK